MLLSLKQLFEVVGESQPLDFSLDLPDCELGGVKLFPQPVSVKGSVFNRAGIVTLQATCDMTMHLVCDRCLTEFERKVSLPVSHILVQSTNTDNDEYVVVEDMTLDLDELLRADILLSLPSKILCKEDCKACVACAGRTATNKSATVRKNPLIPGLKSWGIC